MFSIDGVQWNVPCRIERAAEIRASEISGMLLDKSWFNDVLGTYLQYTVSVAVPPQRRDDFDVIYEKLTDPVDAHSFVLPYNGGAVTITGRVTDVTDTFVRLPGGGQYWKGTRFTVIANHPSKALSLSQVLARGRSPLPEMSEVQTGDLYVYTSSGWQKADYADADATYY